MYNVCLHLVSTPNVTPVGYIRTRAVDIDSAASVEEQQSPFSRERVLSGPLVNLVHFIRAYSIKRTS